MNRPVLGAVLVASLALAGCGGTKDEDKAAEPAPTTASSAPTASASATPSAAPAGTGLDTSFGSGGVVKLPLASSSKDRLSAVAFSADGDKLYAAGLTTQGSDQKLALVRTGTDGKFDESFGTDGVASVNVSTNNSTVPAAQLEQARSLAVQKDGKVVVVGTAEHDGAATGDAAKDTDMVAVRFDTSGALDKTFGSDGVARIDLSTGRAKDAETFLGADQGYGSAILPDGGIVVFGNTGSEGKENDFALVGLTPAGVLDKDFGTAGVTRFDLDDSVDSARNVAVVDGKIVATGYAKDEGVVKPVLIRTSLDGKPDTTFGTSGFAIQKLLGAVAESYQFGVQGDKFVLTGYGKDAESDKVDLVAYRFTSDGDLDTSFGTNGLTRIDNVGEDDRGRNLVVLPDGRILYVGSGKVDAKNIQAMVVLLSKDGKPESGFGTGGKILTDLGTDGDSWYGVALSKDGKTAYLAGYSNVSPEDVSSDDSYLGRLDLS